MIGQLLFLRANSVLHSFVVGMGVYLPKVVVPENVVSPRYAFGLRARETDGTGKRRLLDPELMPHAG